MDKNLFIENEFSFIDDVKNSSCYREMKELSDQIEHDSHLQSLAKKRDDVFLSAQNIEDEAQKKEMLKEFARIDDEIKNDPLVIEYLDRYTQLRRMLNHLQDALLREIKI